MKAQDIIQEIDNTLQAHNYVKKIGTYEYQFKEPLEDEVYLFQWVNDHPLEFQQTPISIHLTLTEDSQVKCHLKTKSITCYKGQTENEIDFYVASPFDIKQPTFKQETEKQLQTSPPPRHGKTWLTEQLNRINEKLRKK